MENIVNQQGYNPTQRRGYSEMTLEDDFKSNIVAKFKKYLTVEQLEELEKVAIEKFSNYNPHI